MQRLGLFTAALLATAIGATSAHAGETFRREAQRAQALAANLETAVGAVEWSCAAGRCVGLGPKTLDSLMKECRKVSVVVGPLTSYQRAGRALTPREMATCNRLAGNGGYSLAGATR
jgi:hypothetical protein